MGAPKSNTLTPRDLEVAALVWRCFKTEPQIDFEKLAQLAKFKNPASASACWNPIKKKLMSNAGGADANSAPSAPSTPATGGRKRKNVPSTDDADDDDKATPAPKARKKAAYSSARGKKTASLTPVADADDDDEERAAPAVKKEEPGGDAGDDEALDGFAFLAAFDPSEPYAA
ncbi:Gpi transamidase component pig-u [Neofusicoccum parvum]|uniref:Gpi transamidase component pig-u n=1 Tax=Neofusicoccum parvum TaxID=310453 RepID=A0ACB5SBF8_9PEZI|nr:Gpi transamidase component pig-u [Neofusicoccum parvum]